MNTRDNTISKLQPQFPDDLWDLVKENGRKVQFQRGEYLYWQNDNSPGVYCLEKGRVRVFQILDNGTESILYNIMEKSIVGEVSTFNGEISSPAAIAMTNVTAYLITPEKTVELVRTNGAFAMFLIDSLVHKLRMLSDQFGVVSGKRVLCRLAAILNTLDYYGVPCNSEHWFTITHAELAGLISTTRPNTTALLNQLADEGLIELGRNMIRIRDKEGLQELSESEVQSLR